MARSKSSLLIDSPVMPIQLTMATFVGTTNWLATQLVDQHCKSNHFSY